PTLARPAFQHVPRQLLEDLGLGVDVAGQTADLVGPEDAVAVGRQLRQVLTGRTPQQRLLPADRGELLLEGPAVHRSAGPAGGDGAVRPLVPDLLVRTLGELGLPDRAVLGDEVVEEPRPGRV